ncbi:MAG: hypothetical protein M1822_009931 [Bathelium mastoideum]|nr:MAG: hypothetical protein M1822_009931 [Bathelium mastoideum]
MAGKSVLRHGPHSVECHWSINQLSARPSRDGCWQSVDFTLRKTSIEHDHIRTSFPSPSVDELVGGLGKWTRSAAFRSSPAFQFLRELLFATIHVKSGLVRGAKLIVPTTPGYIVRSDIIPLRMVDCLHSASVISFCKPQQWLSGISLSNSVPYSLEDVFAEAAAGIVVEDQSSTEEIAHQLDLLEIDIRNRLSFPWLLHQVPHTKTLAMVRGALRSPEHGGTGSNIYSTAKALGISIVVLDSPGHWLENSEYRGLCDAFLPIDMDRNSKLPTRIVDALSRYNGRIDGIVTYFESYAPFVARAATRLSLPTPDIQGFEIAADKYKTSVADGHKAFDSTSSTEALRTIHSSHMKYPLIVKPCRGWSSEGVYKVDDIAALTQAIDSIDSDRHGDRFVIEEYCDGPEVDANLILCNGELLFFEVSDDFPKIGDGDDISSASSFIELANVLPSKLPSTELDLLRDRLHKTLLRLGFRTGVFHLEARVKDSAMEYTKVNGLLDLEPRKIPSQAPPTSWLIEINPRPPGIQASDAVECTYGVDYVALGLLFPILDFERAKALSRPFLNGPQYWCEMVFIPVEHGGMFDADDVCDELKHRRPDLARHISKSMCFFKRGEMVPSPASGHNAWIAYFNVYSRQSRKEVLVIADTIRQELRYNII